MCTADRWLKLSVFSALLITWLSASLPTHADDQHEINRDVSAALERFRSEVKNGAELLRDAKGVLVIPNVKKAALVVGGQWGEGALRVNNHTVAYYKLDAASIGLQAGYKQADFVFLYLTDEALHEVRTSNGWVAGSSVSATEGELSAGTSLDTLRSKHPVVGIAMADGGVMGDVSLAGVKLSRFHPEK